MSQFLSQKGVLVVTDTYDLGTVSVPEYGTLRVDALHLYSAATAQPERVFGIEITRAYVIQSPTGEKYVRQVLHPRAFLDFDEVVELVKILAAMEKLGEDGADGRREREAFVQTRGRLRLHLERKGSDPSAYMQTPDGGRFVLTQKQFRELRALVERGLARLRELGAR